MPRRLTKVLLLTTFALTAGCGKNEYAVVPVAGVVTCQGKPVPYAVVTFNPERGQRSDPTQTGKASSSATDEEGRFNMSTYDYYDGALTGKHKVGIGLMMDPESMAARKRIGYGNDCPCAKDSKDVTITEATSDLRLDF
ncbi:MAG TPA: hypothetical protein VM510_13400 [Caulifigura sp.]|jgi:hypothetical protein|nr:hypothetical protein [Caulifigura sp.]